MDSQLPSHRRRRKILHLQRFGPHLAVLSVYFDLLRVYFEVVYSARQTWFLGTARGSRHAYKPNETKCLEPNNRNGNSSKAAKTGRVITASPL
jgi:hypothetical protein